MGSTGNRAEVAVDKGKNLFATGENPLTLTMGTKKQTASDPYDRRSQRMSITRPFSEDEEIDMPGLTEVDNIEEMLEAVGQWIKSR
jgi:hypothetical protein